MPLFTPYFSLDSSAFRVGNGGRLRCRMGASGIGIYVMLLSHLRDCRDCRAPLDYDMLAFDLHEDAAAVRRVVEDFGLFDIDRSSGTFTSSVLTTVRGLLSDGGAAAGVGTTRTVRQRRVRSSGETYRRAVRRLAEDNALPPAEEEEPAEGENQLAERDAEPAEVKNEPAEELPTSSENEITPAEGEPQPAELDAPLADEENATGDFAPTSIAAEGEPAEVKHEAADADSTPTEGEREPVEEEDVPTAFADAHSPRREENRKEQNKRPHTPIVPFPQSGKGTHASHPAAAVVGAQEGGDASAEGDEEPVEGNPPSIPSASAERDAPPCAAAPTVLGTPAQTLAPHPSPDTANGTTSVPNGASSAEKGETSTNHSQPNSLTANGKTTHPNPDAANPNEHDTHPSGKMQNGTSSVPNGRTSAEYMEMSTNHSQPNSLTASEKTAHPNPDTANGTTSTENPNGHDTLPSGKMQNGESSVPNGQTDTTNSPTSTTDAQSNALTTSEKANEASRGEEGAVEAFVPPTANEVRRFAETLHHPEFDAEWFVAYYTERHWRRHNGRPVVSWQTTARYWLDYPLRVARHLLDHRPAASPVSVGVGAASAVVVPPAGTPTAKPVGTSTYPAAGPTSSTSPGTYPAGMGISPAAVPANPVGTGAPHVGSLSLPAPTPLQQSRLSDLKGMVLHLFADAPAAAPASATTAPDVPAAAADVPAAAADVSTNASTPDWVARNSVRPARALSPAEAAQVIAQQTLASAEAEAAPRVVHDSTADTEEIIDTQASPTNAAEASVRACDNSTADAAKDIDAMPFSTTDAEEDARNGHDSTTDAAKGFETQVLSPADAEESVRACDNSTDEDGEDIDAMPFSTTDAEEGARNGHDSTTDNAEDIDTMPFSTADTEEGARNGHDSTTDAAEDIETQAFSTTYTEEGALNGHDSTTDNAEDIDAQAFSTTDTEEGALNGHDSTTDAAKDIETQAFSTTDTAGSLGVRAFSTDKGRWGVRSPRGPDPPTDDGRDSNAIRHAGNDTGNDFIDTGNDFADAENNFTAKPSNFSADRHSPAAVGTALAADLPIFAADECRPLHTFTEKHPYLNPSFHEPHPLLRLHPPSFGGFGRTFRVQSAQPPFGRSFLGRFVDIRPACTVGSRPLRPRLTLCRTERGRCRPEHPDRERTTAADAAERFANEPEHGTDGRKRHDSAPERSANAIRPPADAPEHLADAPEHGAQRSKNADFIDVDPARGHKIDRNESEHRADECPDAAYDLDAGQRVLRSAAHRRAVRAEREACCGALRHLAHCCVAF